MNTKMICGVEFPVAPTAPSWAEVGERTLQKLEEGFKTYKRNWEQYHKDYSDYYVAFNKATDKLSYELQKQGLPSESKLTLRGLQLPRYVGLQTWLYHGLLVKKSDDQSYRFVEAIRDLENKRLSDESRKATEEFHRLKSGFTQNAVVFLQERGKVLGKDFTLENAYETARPIALKEAIDSKLAVPRVEWFDFDDQNCDGPCAGWDGQSHRCECGNRRVNWVMDDFNGTKAEVHAEAY